MKYILVVFLHGYYQAFTLEFDSLQTCREAQSWVQKVNTHNQYLATECLKK